MLLEYWTTPELGMMPAAEARIISALRLWVVMNRLGRLPMQPVAERLGSARAAAHLHLLIEEIGAAWPEPFCVSPPCCRRLSHDEATVGAMVAIAGRGDRRGFDHLLEDLLPPEVRERLFLSSSMLARNVIRRGLIVTALSWRRLRSAVRRPVGGGGRANARTASPDCPWSTR